MIEAIALLKAAIALITLVATLQVPDELRMQVMSVANQAIQVANIELAKLPSLPATTTPMSETTPAPQPAAEPEAPVQSARIEIVSPMGGKGLGRAYKHSPEIVDESNYIELGAVLFGADGEVNKDASMTITATDGEQSEIKIGTGNIQTYYEAGQRKERHYYHFHYEFKTAGKHTITFSALGVQASVEMDVQ